MNPIIECVPNFSEGRDRMIIDQITSEIVSVEGVKLLDVNPGKDTNRTVVTMAGQPEAVIEAAFRAVRMASKLINMAVHHGAHPRMGATDVCPLIPVSGLTLTDCVEYANRMARRIGEELGIPVYLYGEAATREDRKRLPDIRAGEYEALPEKMKRPDFKPDYGPSKFNASAGATAVGVRDFMLAYNVNLNTRDAKLAKEIAMTIRETGRAKRGRDGKIVRDADGQPVQIPGKLQFCQAGGWYMESFGYAQVTMNLHAIDVTGLHTAFDAVCAEASRLGLRVTGSELVGLAPRRAILDAGVHYLRRQGKNIGIPESAVIQTAIHTLGLNETSAFKPEERIIEYCLDEKKNRLVDFPVRKFIDELSSESPAPGGGSVSALSGALSAALCSMVANLTFGKKNHTHHNKRMADVSVKAQSLKTRFSELVDLDTDAFNTYMTAVRMPKKTDEEIRIRDEAVEAAAKRSAEVPMETLSLVPSVLELAASAAKHGNASAVSDAAVAAIQAEAAAEGAWMNVIINLQSIRDRVFTEELRKQSNDILVRVQRAKRTVIRIVKRRLAT
ncbi:glutamate formimidoyltransferase [bacterium]|nr:glutamate formimidoyltransferase [bacterium]